MAMTNAQAALIAASNSAVRGSAVPVEPLLRRAEELLAWLDSQDAPEDVNLASIRELHKPKAIVQCTAASANYTPCLLAAGHQGEHRNSTQGEYWGDAPAAPEPPVHFYTGLNSAYAPCGVFMQNESPVSTSIDHVTCVPCRVALGL